MPEKKSSEKLIEQMREDYAFVFGSEAGKRVLEDLLIGCHAKRDCFDNDPYRHAFNAGKRSVGLHISSMIEHYNQKPKEGKAKRG